DYYLKALKMDEALGNKIGIANHLGNIGLIYQEQDDYPKALEYFFKALKMNEAIGSKHGESKDLGNIGIVYLSQGYLSKFSITERKHLFEKSLDHLLRALKIDEGFGNAG